MTIDLFVCFSATELDKVRVFRPTVLYEMVISLSVKSIDDSVWDLVMVEYAPYF